MNKEETKKEKIVIALVAHDNKKEDMVAFVTTHQKILEQMTLYATGTTGLRINESTGLQVRCLQSGPLGGDQQIGAMIAYDQMDAIIFLRDPLTAQPHEPDITALLRVCDVHNVPVATNISTAKALIEYLKKQI